MEYAHKDEIFELSAKFTQGYAGKDPIKSWGPFSYSVIYGDAGPINGATTVQVTVGNIGFIAMTNNDYEFGIGAGFALTSRLTDNGYASTFLGGVVGTVGVMLMAKVTAGLKVSVPGGHYRPSGSAALTMSLPNPPERWRNSPDIEFDRSPTFGTIPIII